MNSTNHLVREHNKVNCNSSIYSWKVLLKKAEAGLLKHTYSFTSARNVLITRCTQKDPPPPQMKLWNPPNIMQQAAKAEKNYAYKLRENICHWDSISRRINPHQIMDLVKGIEYMSILLNWVWLTPTGNKPPNTEGILDG